MRGPTGDIFSIIFVDREEMERRKFPSLYKEENVFPFAENRSHNRRELLFLCINTSSIS
jgi:hypothetical protein